MKTASNTSYSSFYVITTRKPDDNGHWRVVSMEVAVTDDFGTLVMIDRITASHSLKDGAA